MSQEKHTMHISAPAHRVHFCIDLTPVHESKTFSAEASADHLSKFLREINNTSLQEHCGSSANIAPTPSCSGMF
eukprot:4740634-Amphidinium_carterae.1